MCCLPLLKGIDRLYLQYVNRWSGLHGNQEHTNIYSPDPSPCTWSASVQSTPSVDSPVPRSRILDGLSPIGALCSLPPMIRFSICAIKSSLSFSFCALRVSTGLRVVTDQRRRYSIPHRQEGSISPCQNRSICGRFHTRIVAGMTSMMS